MPDERSPLLQFPGSSSNGPDENLGDLYAQFCHLVGIKPVNFPPGQKFNPQPESLFQRATKHRRNQNATYMFSATVSNGLLLSQVMLGAALTGLGASESSHILITVFGALNTVIAGVLAFVKSRGQPMRARMFRDDLDRVVDEIENSAVMWLGISNGVHGYDAIDTDDQVTVRSEVARLTRLYDKAVKTNTMNDPDTYSAGNLLDAYSAATRSRAPGAAAPAPAPALPPAPAHANDAAAGKFPAAPPASAPVPVALDPDASPATQAPTTKIPEPAKPEPARPEPDNKDESVQPPAHSPPPTDTIVTDSHEDQSPPPPAPTPAPASADPVAAASPHDPDESPATAPYHASKKPSMAQDTRQDSAEPTRSSSHDGKENERPSLP